MRRSTSNVKPITIEKYLSYIDMRMEQLTEEAAKCNSQYDRLWYNKVISELHWAKLGSENCFMEPEDIKE